MSESLNRSNPDSNSSNNQTDDLYYIHHSDNPGTLMVTEILTGENYASWSRSMTIALSVKNKIEFVDGSITPPPTTDTNRFKSWSRNNNMVISWILNSVSKEISGSVIYLKTADAIWKELKERFQQSNGPRIFQLKRDIMQLTQNQDTVSTYYTKLKVLWEELSNYNLHCKCGHCVCGGAKEIEQTMSFLMGLNESYSQIRGQILLMDPIPNVNRIFALVVQEERQRSISNISNTNSPVAFNVQSSNFKGNSSGNDTSRNYNRNQKLVCSHCQRIGHTIDKCYRLHGFPPGHKFHSKNSNNRANSAVMIPSVPEMINPTEDSSHDAITGLTNEQCQQIIAMLSGKLASVNAVTTSFNHKPASERETLWNKLGPRKLNLLIWRTRWGRLPTGHNLAKRGVNIPNLCQLRNSKEESENHLFFSVPRVRRSGQVCMLGGEISRLLLPTWITFSGLVIR